MAQSRHRARAGPSPTHGGNRDRHVHTGGAQRDRDRSRRRRARTCRARRVHPLLHPSCPSPWRASRRPQPRVPLRDSRPSAWQREECFATISRQDRGGLHRHRSKKDTRHMKTSLPLVNSIAREHPGRRLSPWFLARADPQRVSSSSRGKCKQSLAVRYPDGWRTAHGGPGRRMMLER
jgi:hypothetical protein